MMSNEAVYDLVHAGDLNGLRNWLNANPDNLNAAIGEGYSALHVACLFGHEKLVEQLVSRSALINLNADNESRATPLHAAVMFREEDAAERIVRLLVDNGAELNAKQRGGTTPLHHAVARGSTTLVKCLIELGADPFLKDDFQRSPADLSREIGAEMNGEEIRTALKGAFSLPLES